MNLTDLLLFIYHSYYTNIYSNLHELSNETKHTFNLQSKHVKARKTPFGSHIPAPNCSLN